MEEPTEEQKQQVIAYFKEQGLELYNVEGINKVYADLAKLNHRKLVHQLFIGKVEEIIGLDTTIKLLTESIDAFNTQK